MHVTWSLRQPRGAHRIVLPHAGNVHLVEVDQSRGSVCLGVGTFTTLAVKTDPNSLRVDWTGECSPCCNARCCCYQCRWELDQVCISTPSVGCQLSMLHLAYSCLQ